MSTGTSGFNFVKLKSSNNLWYQEIKLVIWHNQVGFYIAKYDIWLLVEKTLLTLLKLELYKGDIAMDVACDDQTILESG